jgi:triacylglycerol lipase
VPHGEALSNVVMNASPPLRAPSKLLWAAELPRAAWTVLSWPYYRKLLADAPPGDGRTVMLLPGLLNSDRSNFVMRRFLNRLGYDAVGWGLGRNFGARTVGRDAEHLIARLEESIAASGPVTLVGISLGGLIARLVAHLRPDLVREVVTVSSPFAAPGKATNVWRAFEWATGERLDDPAVVARSAAIAAPLPMPTTAIWSRSDGLVAGEGCRDPHGQAIEIRSSHLGVQIRPDVFLAIGRTLAGVTAMPNKG